MSDKIHIVSESDKKDEKTIEMSSILSSSSESITAAPKKDFVIDPDATCSSSNVEE